MLLVNCGCGEKWHRDWFNIDFNSSSEKVKAYNLLKGIPLKSSSADVVYNSCMLEHLNRQQANAFIRECYRVLKSNGIIRIVVPDLENICKEYLSVLQRARLGDFVCQNKYEYIVIELIDQMTREDAGGEMAKYWKKRGRNERYICERTGHPESAKVEHRSCNVFKSYITNIADKVLSRFEFYQCYQRGKFNLSGELHKWMYDEYSLQKLLEKHGFREISLKSYNVSNVSEWEKYKLEVDKKGNEYKPNCLYMEAVK